MTPVEVVWWDAGSMASGWTDPDDLTRAADKPKVVNTVGYLLARTKRHVIVAMNAKLDGSIVADTTTIPLGCVRSVTELLPRQGGRRRARALICEPGAILQEIDRQLDRQLGRRTPRNSRRVRA